MEKRAKNNSFIKQAGILMVAGIIVKIIGILYQSPLAAIIGDEGNGYYGPAFNMYVMILTISSYSMPTAVSKVISERLVVKEYKNAQRVFRSAMLYVLIVGLIAALLLVFFSDLLVEKNAAIVLRFFAPTIILYGFLGVLRGYFQAHKSMVQTSISQILEQIANAVISILLAFLLVNTVKNSDATTKAVKGAIGSAIGTGCGVLVALLFLIAIYLLNRKEIYKRIQKDQTKHVESYVGIGKILLCFVTPILFSSFVYNASTIMNQTIFIKIMLYVKGMSEVDVSVMYGIFSRKAVVLANIPIAIGAAMSSAIIPTVSSCYAKGELKSINVKIGSGIKATLLISIPAAVGLAVLAEPVVRLLFNQEGSVLLTSRLLIGMSITVIFYQISTISNGVLQGIGAVRRPVINTIIALTIQTIVLVVLLMFTELSVFSLVISGVVYSITICVLNQISVKKLLGYKQEMWKTFIIPFLSSGLMGLIVLGTYKGIYLLCHINILALMLAIIVGGMIYFVLIIRLCGVSESELTALPKGNKLVLIAKKIRLM